MLESTDVTVTLNNTDLDPRPLISRDEMLEIAWEPGDESAVAPTLRVVEWKHEGQGGELFMLDDIGAVVSMHPMKKLAPTLSWSAYLKWEGFGREDVTEGDLLAPDFIWNGLVQAAEAALVAYLARRSDEVAHEVVETWKERAVYPYSDQPTSQREVVERQLFDVVAVTARRGLPKEDTQLRMSLRLLKEAFQHEPSRLPEILEGLLSLKRDEVESLADLLTKTKFAGVITASRAVTDRLEFVQALRELLFSDEHRDRFLERGQLHPLVAENCWIFGEEWHYSHDEIALTTLLRQHLSELRPGAKSEPEGGNRRVDLLLSRVIPEHSEEVDLRRLVVELKRANRRIGEEEVRQIKAYARTITASREAADERSRWEFWLIGADVHPDVEGERRQAGREFGCIDAPETRPYRVWLYTWTELLDKATRKLEFYRERLGYSPAADEALAAVKMRYPEFMPDTTLGTDADEQASA